MLLRRSSRILTQSSFQRTWNELLRRSYSSKVYRFNNNSSNNKFKNISIAILGGSTLILAYSLFSQSTVISLESLGEQIRRYTTIKKEPAPTSHGFVILDDSQVNNRLRNLEESYLVNRGTGIVRYDISQLPSNHPIEDNHVERILSQDNNDIYFFGIFDGHGGPFTSSRLSQDIIKYVSKQLLDSKESMDNSIVKGFINLDNDIIFNSFRKIFQDSKDNANLINLLPAISGSCALLSIFDSTDSTLKVAVTGDSRALLGGIENNEWYVKSLSTDQTGDSPSEIERIQNEHPDEPNVIRRGRILGSLQPSRAFGDYRYKLNQIDGKSLRELPENVRMFLRTEPKEFKTPPYVTAKPEITTTKIDSNMKFLVLASDGLFELLTNEEIAALVIKWRDHYILKTAAGNTKKNLPLVKDISQDKDSLRPTFRYRSSVDTVDKVDYLLEDSNVATHLIRNALSVGGQKEYVSRLVSIPSPMSRKYRDDLTVTVAFFGENDKIDGTTVTNHAATRLPTPKL
ncbi:hypothetical protein KAFR_0J01860 [Kazachstania africana CBS 2517]|uniref:PPM-type phosphatase domain-containing protein n=1 Tax=Kazachstania africana (strain ATCC 22294 / BCRC 22015 / CBS 2517 / CECT 1963 / NBRC 1671 / NRRL Y-8276) TaxID=1071382 RepID=H2B0V0_KAZAF|nr:hypothetical protein KAFR_0J01860 [Kazachstania africana CBS 2517]CCF60250.1 hypothetical protein KAFR_0J01860 [Kazachstania africana CBS 2517]